MVQPDIVRPSPNFTPGPWLPRAIVFHSTRGNANEDEREFQGTLNWFASPTSRASAQWVIAIDGRKARCVDDANMSWHAKEHSLYSFGIELVQRTINHPITEPQYRSLAKITLDYHERFGIPLVHVPGLANGERGLIEHQETEQGRRDGKSDIGPQFNWDYLLSLIRLSDPWLEQAIAAIAPVRQKAQEIDGALAHLEAHLRSRL